MHEALFTNHVNLVYKIAHRMNYGYIDVDDLIQVGLMALYEASLKYKEDFNTKFSTYASIYIIGSIKKELRKNKGIKLNREIIKLVRKIKNTDENLSVEQLACKFSTSKENIILAINYSDEMVSLNTITNTDELIKFIPDQRAVKDVNEDLVFQIKQLDPLSRQIIYLKYYRGYSQAKIAKMIGTTQSSVSRLEKKALEQMKAALVM